MCDPNEKNDVNLGSKFTSKGNVRNQSIFIFLDL